MSNLDGLSYVNALPQRVREFLEDAPARGDGLNHWTICAAHRLHRCGVEIPESVMEDILEHYAGRDLKPGEALRAIRRSHPDNPGSNGVSANPKWPKRNLEEIERIATEYPGIPGLHRASSANGEAVDAEEAIDMLFPGNPLLCIGATLGGSRTLPREEWRGILAAQQFVVPSPMLTTTGRTQDGRMSPRTLTNIGARRFLVIEFDFREKDSEGVDTSVGPLLRHLRDRGVSVADLCASLHLHLSRYWPLAMVVHSGGKSLHGWYPCSERSEDDLLAFMRFAVSLGADPATWTRCQLVRLPSGTRRPGAIRQRIQFINPSVLAPTFNE